MKISLLDEYLNLLPDGQYDLESIYQDWLAFVWANSSIKSIPTVAKFKTLSQNAFKWSRNDKGEYWGKFNNEKKNDQIYNGEYKYYYDQ
jgi:hypothetical protein